MNCTGMQSDLWFVVNRCFFGLFYFSDFVYRRFDCLELLACLNLFSFMDDVVVSR